GTLAEGSLSVGAQVEVDGRLRRVRGLQSLDTPHDRISAVARVAVNLADLPAREVGRGSVLLAPGAWPSTSLVDVRILAGVAEAGSHSGGPVGRAGICEEAAAGDLPAELMMHVGTRAVQVRVRPLGGDVARLGWADPLPLAAGDRVILRNPGTQQILCGAVVLDAEPPALRRRGAARARAGELRDATGTFDLAAEVGRRGMLSTADVYRLTGQRSAGDQSDGVHSDGAQSDSVQPDGVHSDGVLRHGDYLVSTTQWQRWSAALLAAVDQASARRPLEPGLPQRVAASTLALPDPGLLIPLSADAGLQIVAGQVLRPGAAPDLGPAEQGLRAIEDDLRARPFAAPERDALDAAGLGARELAAAARLGRVVRLPGDIVLLPDAPARAMRELAALPQPFTLSDARQALDSTRRVVIPLLEHLDGRGWTRRVDSQHRQVVRG
ncbi:MAG: SelB C-terminal domain-containing protein, partial [Actinomycetales bacterium]